MDLLIKLSSFGESVESSAISNINLCLTGMWVRIESANETRLEELSLNQVGPVNPKGTTLGSLSIQEPNALIGEEITLLWSL